MAAVVCLVLSFLSISSPGPTEPVLSLSICVFVFRGVENQKLTKEPLFEDEIKKESERTATRQSLMKSLKQASPIAAKVVDAAAGVAQGTKKAREAADNIKRAINDKVLSVSGLAFFSLYSRPFNFSLSVHLFNFHMQFPAKETDRDRPSSSAPP
jgi:hypothetical protein